MWTFRLIDSIGPEGWCFEKLLYTRCSAITRHHPPSPPPTLAPHITLKPAIHRFYSPGKSLMTSVAHSLLYSNEYSGVVEITKSAMFQELNKDSPIYSKCCSTVKCFWRKQRITKKQLYFWHLPKVALTPTFWAHPRKLLQLKRLKLVISKLLDSDWTLGRSIPNTYMEFE